MVITEMPKIRMPYMGNHSTATGLEKKIYAVVTEWFVQAACRQTFAYVDKIFFNLEIKYNWCE